MNFQEYSASPARLDRARATLERTHATTANDWLHELTRRNLRRVDARRTLAAEAEEREQLTTHRRVTKAESLHGRFM